MRTHFPGYFLPNEKEKKELWDTAFFSFDANILLGLYRYSDDTKDRFLELLERIKNRCWIPHQVAKEFLRNRLEVIKEQADAYDKASSELDTVAAKFAGEHRHPFLPEETFKQLSDSIDAVKADLENSKKRHLSRLDDDDIFKKLEKIFETRVGPSLTEEELDNIQKEGDSRYQRKIPPGYKDASKNDPSDPTRKFGDLFVWKQLITQSKQRKSGVIFICDDRKEDWWSEFNGKTLGPRPELVKEFSDECQNTILVYRPHRFLEFAAKHFKTKAPLEAISEIKSTSSVSTDDLPQPPLHVIHFNEQLQQIRKKRDQAAAKIFDIKLRQSKLREDNDFERFVKWDMESQISLLNSLIVELDKEAELLTDDFWKRSNSQTKDTGKS